ncbi:fumarylacetoacetase [Glaciimonas immobilis]|uniref:fumarylacetoacetase n=1 Tax=Glaciimonas immobilis TaxID=728004 RepID=A0A840S019_9BURK|nr:fumarylacetoacetase [Glaciimonas immobilis]KAF3998427.1 fumarylacetoacetase [Glaciimonas immobilis]MBB5202081.1 fumarylacetoacetase [Glaciimonas immobilis]
MPPNDPALKSFIATAPESHFPIQNLPFGIFSSVEDATLRVGVAIGDHVVDLALLADADLLPLPSEVFRSGSLNQFVALGHATWRVTRELISHLLRDDNPLLRDDHTLRSAALLPQEEVTLHLPMEIAGYTDFYSSKEHATNVGSMFRDPENALLPNWLHMPIGYNGRASSVVVSGTALHRPKGQLKLPDSDAPIFAPSRKLDFELEAGFFIGQPNALGDPINIAVAEQHIFGMVLLNDWSARDLQQWEYVPLGPFNSKSFGTSISPWVVTMEALEPFRVASPAQVPVPLPYLQEHTDNGFDITLEVTLKPAEDSSGSSVGQVICKTNFKAMYWTMAQQLAHHTVSGCNTKVGDLMGSGTISGNTPDACGSLLELTRNGQNPLTLTGGAQRGFIQDGDEISMTGWCQGDGYRVGFGNVVGKILPVQ